MKSRATPRFWDAYRSLPEGIREQAREAYARFSDDPAHPGLRFKKVHAEKPIYSVRATRDYRALGVKTDDEIVWFWIGSHEDYDRLLKQL